MKKFLIDVLVRVLGWLDDSVWHIALPEDLRLRAAELTGELVSWDASGEAKRHRVLAQLKKEFPQMATKAIALAIEWTVNA